MKRLSLSLVGPLLLALCVLTTCAQAAGPPSARRRRALGKPQSQAAKMRAKLKQIVIPRIAFEEANVADVIRHLVKLSRQYDPEGKGVNIVLLHGPRSGAARANVVRTSQTGDQFQFDGPGTSDDGATESPAPPTDGAGEAAQQKTE